MTIGNAAKVVFAILAGAAGIGLIAWNILSSDGPSLAGEAMLIDLRTGDRFVADISGPSMIMIPERHPEDGARTLIPIDQTEDGAWVEAEPGSIEAVLETYEGDREDLKVLQDSTGSVLEPSERRPVPFKRYRAP